jgi:hypothetical protein
MFFTIASRLFFSTGKLAATIDLLTGFSRPQHAMGLVKPVNIEQHDYQGDRVSQSFGACGEKLDFAATDSSISSQGHAHIASSFFAGGSK